MNPQQPDDSTAEEAAAYSRLEDAARAAGWLSRRATITSCESHWQQLVMRLESGGYEYVLDEYRSEVSAREVLERAITALPDHLATSLKDRVAPWDARYRDATVKAPHRYWPGGWWADRLPPRGSALYFESAKEYLPQDASD
jgi:hypothetical protein